MTEPKPDAKPRWKPIVLTPAQARVRLAYQLASGDAIKAIRLKRTLLLDVALDGQDALHPAQPEGGS